MTQEEARELARENIEACGLEARGYNRTPGVLDCGDARVSVPANGFVQFIPANPTNGCPTHVLVECVMEIPL